MKSKLYKNTRNLQIPRNKFNAKKITVDGVEFASISEARRYGELKLRLLAGEISCLELQKTYELIPAAYEEVPTGEVYRRGEHRGEQKLRRICVEKAVNYVADFVYRERSDSGELKTVVEDVKGFRDPSSAAYKVFVIKRKLMLYKYGAKIREVYYDD